MLTNLRNVLAAVSKIYKISSLSFSGEVNKCQPQHLICFKDWTSDMVLDVLISAMSLKVKFPATLGCKRLAVLDNCKVTILQEVNQPALCLAVSKAATMLGAYDVTVVDSLMWEHDYVGRVFSLMSDVIFVSTSTHWCVQRFSKQSTVPVICMTSRTHSSMQALATIMAILEEFGSLTHVNIAYVGSPHPVLNSYLLLCPMLGANIKFKCCCEECPVSPLLYNISAKMVEQSHTISKPYTSTNDVLSHANVIIAGPTPKKNKLNDFRLTDKNVSLCAKDHWIFFHTCPRGPEVNDELFSHTNSRTFHAYANFHYIAAALMTYCMKNYKF